LTAITDRSISTGRPANTSATNTTGRRTALTSLSLTDSRNDPNLTPVCFSTKSMHTRSLTIGVPRPRPATNTTNRSNTTS
jgi:hypothetical protein